MKELNEKLLTTIMEWDPYASDSFTNDAEAADVITAVHNRLSSEELAVQIQKIYEQSFEEKIPMGKCLDLAERLHQMFISASC
jgi:hypothetical protein